MKVRRPAFERQLDEHGHPIADSDAEAEPEADDEEEIDENYWLREDADERAYNKAVALDNTPQLGQCGVWGQPNHSCYDYTNGHVSERSCGVGENQLVHIVCIRTGWEANRVFSAELCVDHS